MTAAASWRSHRARAAAAGRPARPRALPAVRVRLARDRARNFSYRSSDEDGNVVIASPFLDDIAELFSADWRERRRRRLLADVVWSEEAPDRTRADRGPGVREGCGRTRCPEIDGAPATRILSEQALSHVRHREIVSAGALETFASCPVRWLVERQLAPKDSSPTPIRWCAGRSSTPCSSGCSRGSRARSRRTRSMRRAAAARGDARPDAAAERSKLALDQSAEVRTAILRGIEAELRRYLRHEAADGSEWPPLITELRFGLDREGEGAVPPVELDDGRERALLSGIVDRVDADPRDPVA